MYLFSRSRTELAPKGVEDITETSTRSSTIIIGGGVFGNIKETIFFEYS